MGHILGYKASLNKFNSLEIPQYHIRSQQDKTRPQQEKKLQKIFKLMETEQHTVE
jgi:hypothetical protein